MRASLTPHARQRLAVAAAVALTVACAPASAEGRAVMAAASQILDQSAAPILERAKAQACRLLLMTGAAWPARGGTAVGSWT